LRRSGPTLDVRRLETLAGSRRGAAALFGLGLLVYGLVSVGLPLVAGRDFPTYVAWWVQIDEWHSVLPMTMLFRTPVAPIVGVGPLAVLGPWVAQAWFAALYAGSIVAWAAVARRAGPRAALLTAAGLLAYPGYVLLFHRLASDAVFAAMFALWALLVARAVERPTGGRFALVGLGVAGLALTRPGNQVLLLAALMPLLLPLARRRRAWLAAATLVPATLVLVAWSVNNGLRYDDYAVARGGGAYLPFFRVFTTDHLVDPANGWASRQLGVAIERDLLPREPYSSRGIDLDMVLANGSDGLFEDVLNLSDRSWGWGTDYAMLRRAAFESIRAHPGAYASGVLSTLGRLLWQPFFYELESSPAPDAVPRGSPATAASEESRELIPSANQSFYVTTPDRRVTEIWQEDGTHGPVFRDPVDAQRYATLQRGIEDIRQQVPAYSGNPTLTLQVSRASKLWPRGALWLVVGLVAVLVRRPRGTLLALVLATAGLLVLLLDAAAIYAVAEFAVPVVPAFVCLAAVGLVGRRAEATDTVPARWSTSRSRLPRRSVASPKATTGATSASGSPPTSAG
jgi:hypothetical protein